MDTRWKHARQLTGIVVVEDLKQASLEAACKDTLPKSLSEGVPEDDYDQSAQEVAVVNRVAAHEGGLTETMCDNRHIHHVSCLMHPVRAARMAPWSH